jgi:hypothetical protein
MPQRNGGPPLPRTAAENALLRLNMSGEYRKYAYLAVTMSQQGHPTYPKL